MGTFTSQTQDRRYVPPLGGRPSPEGTLLGGPPPAPPTYYDPDPNVVRVNVSPELPPGTKLEDGPGQIVVLPDGSRIPDADEKSRSPTGHVMSPKDNLAEVAAAGRRAGEDFRRQLQSPQARGGALLDLAGRFFRNVGTGGKYDYQRDGHQILGCIEGFTQLRQFRPIANVNVGLYCQQAGLSLEETLTVAGRYARIFSSNADSSQPYGLDPRTAHFIREGYRIGQSGMFDRPR